MSTIGDVMTEGVVTVQMDEPLHAARALFARYRFHHLPVLTHARLVGVVSDRDVMRALSPFVERLAERRQDLETLEVRVHAIMSRRLVVADPSMSIAEAAALLLEKRISCLPVLDDGKLVGIVSSHDLLRQLLPEPSLPAPRDLARPSPAP